jgi:hypothetical protein
MMKFGREDPLALKVLMVLNLLHKIIISSPWALKIGVSLCRNYQLASRIIYFCATKSLIKFVFFI